MGYFASLETKENTPIDVKEEELGGTRRSTRKRKSALYEEYLAYSQNDPPASSSTRRSKRASLEPSPKLSNSLEELIGEQQHQIELDPPNAIKKEPTPPMPISPTTATTERMARLKVMSIDFLCGSDEEMSPAQKERRVSDCPLLDILVDAALDAPYLQSNEQHHHQPGQITVVVNPEIHRDAAHRVYLQQQQQLQQQQSKPDLQRSRHSKESLTQPDSPQSSSLDSSESKADSAVSLSPRIQMTSSKHEQEENDHFWRREMDDRLFENYDDFDDFLDNVSDLSSVSSTELSSWTTEEEEEEEQKLAPLEKSKKTASLSNQQLASLTCIACSRPIMKKDVSEQVGADLSVTNELATWTWSPSAMFTDWKPERCPRCERHFVIFGQEWPNRKIKKKHVLNNEDKKSKKTSRKIKKKSSTNINKKSTLSSSSVIDAAPEAAVPEPVPGTPLYLMQDDPNDLSYIPPSPLSDPHYEDDPF
ncbi:hypothetical protein BD408DRAFT_167347 [Parasitella parasitica]|nr:hypothetical protein BD408DRAFT_167347 [Parasitella parasitica]